jgi:hypothetical protein
LSAKKSGTKGKRKDEASSNAPVGAYDRRTFIKSAGIVTSAAALAAIGLERPTFALSGRSGKSLSATSLQGDDPPTSLAVTPYLSEPATSQEFILIDSIRDATFLSTGGADMGLGVIDNPFFFYSSQRNPSTGAVRPYQLMWLGSPAGTQSRPQYSLYCADVIDLDNDGFADSFYPNAPASAWLTNPREVLSIGQAASDIISWFDANYPGGAVGGVGLSNSGSNSQYGTLAGGDSPVGSVATISELVQAHIIYDSVDDTALLYFSVNTGNFNSLAIYCYKIADPTFSSPATSSEFLGGLSGAACFGSGVIVDPEGTAGSTVTQAVNILSSPRFVVSRDPLSNLPTSPAGNQIPGIIFYSYGVVPPPTSSTSGWKDHGASVAAGLLNDLHGNPIAPTNNSVTLAPGASWDPYQYPVDKFGSVMVTDLVDGEEPCYTFLFSTPSTRDVRGTSNSVVLTSIKDHVGFYNAAGKNLGIGMKALTSFEDTLLLGRCRPYFTHLPDGIPKLTYGAYQRDGYINGGAHYLDADALSPRSQDRIVTIRELSYMTIYRFGKKKMSIFHTTNTPLTPSSTSPQWLSIKGIATLEGPSTLPRQEYYLPSSLAYFSLRSIRYMNTPLRTGNVVVLQDLPVPYVQILTVPGAAGGKFGTADSFYAEVYD